MAITGERMTFEARGRVLSSLLLEHPEAPITALDHDGRFAAVPATMAINGRPVLTGSTALDLVDREHRVPVIEAWDRARTIGVAQLPVTLADGSAARIFFVDATEDHDAFFMILAGHQPARDRRPVFEPSVPVRFAEIRRDDLGAVVGTTPEVVALLGWADEELRSQPSLDLVHPDDHERVISCWMAMLAEPSEMHRWRGRYLHRDGRWLWLETTYYNHLVEPGGGYVRAELVDVTEQVLAEQALQRSEVLLRRLATALPVAVAQLDVDRRVVFVNERAQELLGLKEGATAADVVAGAVAEDRPALAAAIDDAFWTGGDQEVVARIDQSGLVCHGSWTLCSVESGPGDERGVLVCVSDVTDSVTRQIELETLASTDYLTGCLNRPAVMAHLGDCLAEQPPVEGAGVGVIFVDLDGFKPVNDSLGHAAGDRLLVAIADRMLQVLAPED
ncbi:MAG TPA: sensor domain-containing diguanylate cyclase, partial [Acidimicrobiales bacterium]